MAVKSEILKVILIKLILLNFNQIVLFI